MELYVHIPFCRQKCRYCAFTSFVGQETSYEAYVNLLLAEAELRKSEAGEGFCTAYIGGGTPSLLPPRLLRKLIDGLRSVLDIGQVTEFTSEANPGTVTREWLQAAYESGIDRLSFGMQACQDTLLKQLGRIHRFEDVRHSVMLARDAGFQNISLDLMFGIPGQSIEQWRETLRNALSLSPVHLSAYGLIPEEGTPLFSDLESGILSLPDPEKERMMYDDTIRILCQHGLKQYEISSFAAEGRECRHNIGYWTQVPYLGLGVSAASMTGVRFTREGMTYRRRTNPDTLRGYADLVLSGDKEPVSDYVSAREARFESMMLGLRMNRGVCEESFYEMHGVSVGECYGSRLTELEKEGLLEHESGFWKMTRRGFDIQNSILVELMED